MIFCYLVARCSGSAPAPRRARLPSTSAQCQWSMECPTAPRVLLLRLRCDRYVRCGVRVGDGGCGYWCLPFFPGSRGRSRRSPSSLISSSLRRFRSPPSCQSYRPLVARSTVAGPISTARLPSTCACPFRNMYPCRFARLLYCRV